MKKSSKIILFLIVGFVVAGTTVAVYSVNKKTSVTNETGNTKQEKKVLFYRNPMDPSITSPTPMKDSMGMDYIPVYEESEQDEDIVGTVKLTPQKIQKIGVKTEKATFRNIEKTIRTVGKVGYDEARIFEVNTKIDGWIEKLYVNRTDAVVKKSEKLLEIYSPDLVAAQEEYLLALQSKERIRNLEIDPLVDAVKGRLKYWDITDEQIKKLEKDRKIMRTMTVYAPYDGIVSEKMVNEGIKVNSGMTLFKLIDHSQVWIYGELYEYELPFIKVGQRAKIIPSYTPQDVYESTISHIYTHLGSARYSGDIFPAESRTLKIRFDVPNSDFRLKFGQFVNIELKIDLAKNVLAVPESAVIDTGTKQVVFVDKGNGSFEPRDLKIGVHADGFYQILSGVNEEENVVTSATFLIDSESSFVAAIKGMSNPKSDEVR